MTDIKSVFDRYFEAEDKEGAVKFILEKLDSGELDVLKLYTDILTPALNFLECSVEDKNVCIWKEHVKTAITRTIVECCYPYILKKRDNAGVPHKGKAVVLCPPEEYHDLGARMAADMFTVCGYDTIYVGSNTPYNDFYNALHVIKPDVVAISVSNYYNIVVTKKIISDIKDKIDYPVKVIVGGYAFSRDPEKYKVVGAQYCALSLWDIPEILGCEVRL